MSSADYSPEPATARTAGSSTASVSSPWPVHTRQRQPARPAIRPILFRLRCAGGDLDDLHRVILGSFNCLSQPPDRIGSRPRNLVAGDLWNRAGADHFPSFD